jgi:formate hydrogenlyase transcriptional activator
MKQTVLYLDDEPDNLLVFKSAFSSIFNVMVAESPKKALHFLREVNIDLIITDFKMPEQNGIEFLLEASKEFPDISKIMLTAFTNSELVIRTVNEAHVFGFVSKPWNKDELRQLMKSALQSTELRKQNRQFIDFLSQANAQLKRANQEIEELRILTEAENKYLRNEIDIDKGSEFIAGTSLAMKNVMKQIEQVARLKTTVLIQGETGTGKELVARAIHKNSTRVDKPFVKINCASLPPTLVESEIFGHEKSAFTGANQSKPGLFEIANGGTIFLDEIGELPLELQPKLLRVLQEGEFYKVGGIKPIVVDVRVIAATNRVLSKAVEKGTFRSDLYYRLNIFPIQLPPLRERKEDIPIMIKHLVSKCERKLGITITKIPPAVIGYLTECKWAGNIRELEAVLERSMILSQGEALKIADIPVVETEPVEESFNFPSISFHEMEKKYILSVLSKTRGRISGRDGAADILKLNHNTLRSKMIKLGIEIKKE